MTRRQREGKGGNDHGRLCGSSCSICNKGRHWHGETFEELAERQYLEEERRAAFQRAARQREEFAP